MPWFGKENSMGILSDHSSVFLALKKKKKRRDEKLKLQSFTVQNERVLLLS
jgi:hypothetical protein